MRGIRGEMEFTYDDREYTDEERIKRLRKKDIQSLTLAEAKTRIFYAERDFKNAMRLVRDKDKKIFELEKKLEDIIQFLKSNQDIDEEFE